jgi:hypothetical protein
MRKCRFYLLGLSTFQLVVDHQALVIILDKYTLDAVENPKLQRLKERLSPVPECKSEEASHPAAPQRHP